MLFRRRVVYVDYEPVPLTEEDASWDLGDLRVRAVLEKPVRRRTRAAHLDALAAPDFVGALWTAAQVAATSLALGGYVTGAARKWRDKRLKLPEGTRLTLTLTPAKRRDRRGPTRIVITDVQTKTPGEITNEIRRGLMNYAQGTPPGSRWAEKLSPMMDKESFWASLEAEKKLLIITFVGNVASNIVTLAIFWVHQTSRRRSAR